MNLKRTSQSVFSTAVKTIIYLVLIIALVFFAKRGFEFGSAIFSESGVTSAPGVDVKFTIKGSESKMGVAERLLDAGLIEDKMVYYVQSLIYEAKYLPGEYTLNTSMSGEEIVIALSTKGAGETVQDEKETVAAETTNEGESDVVEENPEANPEVGQSDNGGEVNDN